MRLLAALTGASALIALASPALAAPIQAYLKIDGVKGEVAGPTHKKWMQVTGISKLPSGCRGEEGGGSLSVRLVRMPDVRQLPTSANVGGPFSGMAKFEVLDVDGDAVTIMLDDVFASTTYVGALARPIKIGFTATDGAPTDESDVLTLNFKHVTWERPGCTKRDIATR